MKTVELEDIYIGTILTFCENLAELGCPRNAEPDMWFRELPYEEQLKVAKKMIEIEERYANNVSTEGNETGGNEKMSFDIGDKVELADSCASYINGKPQTGTVIDFDGKFYGIRLDSDNEAPCDALEQEIRPFCDKTTESNENNS